MKIRLRDVLKIRKKFNRVKKDLIRVEQILNSSAYHSLSQLEKELITDEHRILTIYQSNLAQQLDSILS